MTERVQAVKREADAMREAGTDEFNVYLFLRDEYNRLMEYGTLEEQNELHQLVTSSPVHAVIK